MKRGAEAWLEAVFGHFRHAGTVSGGSSTIR